MNISGTSFHMRSLWILFGVSLLVGSVAAQAAPGHGSRAASSTRPSSHSASTGVQGSSQSSTAVRSSSAGSASRSRPSASSSKTPVSGYASGRTWRHHIGFGWYDPGYSYWGYPGYSFGLSLGYYGLYPAPYWWGGWGGYYRVPATYGGGGVYPQSYAPPGALDLNVKPKRAEVYVNGQSVGRIGHYDGFPEYLWLEPGSYELIFYLDGYRTERRVYTVRAGLIQDVRFSLEKGPTRPVSELSQPPKPERRRPPATDSWRERSQGESPLWKSPTSSGLLKLDIEPDEATVYLDGRPLGAARELERRGSGLPVAPGDHVLEVVYPGMEGASRSFRMGSDGIVSLQIHLRPAD